MILMFLGGQPATAPFVLSSKFFTLTYFLYLIFSIPVLNYINTNSGAQSNTSLKKNQKISIQKRNFQAQKNSLNSMQRIDEYDKFYLTGGTLIKTQLPFNHISIYIPKTRF